MWVQLDNGRVAHRFEPIVLAAALALIPVLIIDADVHSHGWREVASVANWVIWVVFVAEAILVFSVARHRMAAIRAHWLDLAVVVVTVPFFGGVLSALRLARLARLLRLLRLGAVAARALQAERALTSAVVFRFVALTTLFVVIVAGAVESVVDKSDFPTVWDGMWWAVVTVTTVGYGDLYPKSVEGRIVAMFVMLFGIGFLSVLTATIASRFVQTDTATDDVRATLTRIEDELREIRQQLTSSR